MSFIGTRVTKAKGELIPDAFWEKVLASGVNVCGCAYTEDGKIIWQGEGKAPELKTLQELQEMLVDYEVNFFLGTFPNECNEEDLQPFVTQANDKDDVIVMAMIEGDCSSFAQAGSTRSDAYFAHENIVVPSFQEMWDASGGNEETIYKAASNKTRQSAFQNMFLTRGSLTLICANGAVHHIEKDNALGGEFKWGSASQLHGFTDEEETIAPVVPPAELSMADKIRQGRAAKLVKPATTQQAAPATVVTQVGATKVVKKAVTVEKTAEVVELAPITAKVDPAIDQHRTTVIAIGKKMMQFKVPKGWSNGQKKVMFNHVFGYCPTGWKDQELVICEAHKVPRGVAATEAPIKDLKELGEKMQSSTAPAPDLAPKEDLPAALPQEDKDTETKHIPTDDRPLIPVAQRKDFHERFLNSVAIKEIRNKYASPILSVEEIQEYEKKEPSFSEQTGQDIETTFRWPHSELRQLCIADPDVAAVLLGTYRLGFMKHYKSPVIKQEQTQTPFVSKKVVKKAG